MDVTRPRGITSKTATCVHLTTLVSQQADGRLAAACLLLGSKSDNFRNQIKWHIRPEYFWPKMWKEACRIVYERCVKCRLLLLSCVVLVSFQSVNLHHSTFSYASRIRWSFYTMAVCWESISRPRPMYLVFLRRNIWPNLSVQWVKIVPIYKALCACVCHFECVLVGV